MHPEDRRFVIGKQGRTIDAIRNLAFSAGAARNLKVQIHLVGDDRRSQA